jgi:hypothetical protein
LRVAWLFAFAAAGSMALFACEGGDATDGGAAGAGASDNAGSNGDRCSDRNAKTIDNGYFCLPEGARCAGLTLPCCTDECESNDGQVFNPDDDPSRYLTCDTEADACVRSSGGSGSDTLECYEFGSGIDKCEPPFSYCGVSMDGQDRCCPTTAPYMCSDDGKCYASPEDMAKNCTPWHPSKKPSCVACIAASCHAAGTWTFSCPASESACGVCGIIPEGSVSIAIPDSIAENGGASTSAA